MAEDVELLQKQKAPRDYRARGARIGTEPTARGEPHQGACITRDSVARLMSHRDLRGVPAFAWLLVKFALSSLADVEVEDFLVNAVHEIGKSGRFAAERSTLLVSGLLHSGSGFRDREFFELYRRVAQVVADAARRA